MACSLTMGGFIFYKDDGGEVQDKFMFFSCNIPKQTNLPKSRVNPNLATKEEPWRPVLLAADRGHHGVLDVLATHTEKGVGVSESCWRRSCMLCSWVQATTNWAVWSRDTEETVLHLVLKKSHKVALAGTGRDDGEQEARYRSCLDVLLQSQGSGIVKMQLGRVVNKKDRASVLGIARLSNTALHYAVQLWTELEVAALLLFFLLFF